MTGFSLAAAMARFIAMNCARFPAATEPGDGRVEHVDVQRGYRLLEHSDELDFSFPGRRPYRPLESPAADVDDLIDASTSRELAYREVPIGRRAVVDHLVRSE